MIWGDIKALVQHRWGTDQHEVYVYSRQGRGTTAVLGIEGDEFVWTNYDDGEINDKAKPILLPPAVLKAIVDAGAEQMPPSSQMAEHLKDAREVRDRLLALVERP